ncbi:MAG: methyltransferase domain-containing protein [Burkholderiales bacterium]|nr:methyltransferase domain-containing protein [Phycisphaerae bacterium]
MSEPLGEALFDRYAGNYNAALAAGLSSTGEDAAYFAKRRVEWMQHRLERLHFAPRRVMDFGCGTGGSTPYLLSLNDVESHIGVDISDASIDIAKRLYTDRRTTFAHVDRWHGAGSIDLAFCNGVFHHIPPASRAACVDYVHRALRPGGLFALWENNPWNPGVRLVMSRIPFDRDAITLPPPQTRTLMSSHGFDVLASEFLFIFPKALASLRFLEKPLCRLPIGGQYLTLGRKR